MDLARHVPKLLTICVWRNFERNL